MDDDDDNDGIPDSQESSAVAGTKVSAINETRTILMTISKPRFSVKFKPQEEKVLSHNVTPWVILLSFNAPTILGATVKVPMVSENWSCRIKKLRGLKNKGFKKPNL